jgi:pSer/pThr/pTyr-binding forkhead associated (FHA) protein
MPPSVQRYLIGRDPGCAIPIADDSISRRHAQITLDGSHIRVEDVGSSNGTFLIRQGQKKKIQAEETVFSTDTLQFGEVQLTVKDLLESIQPASSPALPNPAAPSSMIRCACGMVKPQSQKCPGCGQ